MKNLFFACLFLFSYNGITQINTIIPILNDSVTYINQKKYKNIGIFKRFNIGLAIGAFNYFYENKNFLKDNPNYFHINASYRLYKDRLISPEIGLGFIYLDSKEQIAYRPYLTGGYHLYFWRKKEYNAYLKFAFDLQTQEKVAFLLNVGVFSTITFTSIGFSLRSGLKYTISNKIGISLCPEVTGYHGKVISVFKKYGEEKNGVLLHSDKTTRSLDFPYINEPIYSIRLGVHF